MAASTAEPPARSTSSPAAAASGSAATIMWWCARAGSAAPARPQATARARQSAEKPCRNRIAGTLPDRVHVASRRSHAGNLRRMIPADSLTTARRARRGRAAQRRGIDAEAAACAALEHEGWTVLGRRLRTAAGEIDAVAEKDGLLAVLEVKSRPTLALAGGVGVAAPARPPAGRRGHPAGGKSGVGPQRRAFRRAAGGCRPARCGAIADAFRQEA